MKKLTLVVMSLALLLVTATSSFAAIIDVAGAGPYANYQTWSMNYTPTAGTLTADLNLNIMLTGTWNTGADDWQVFVMGVGKTAKKTFLYSTDDASYYTASLSIPLLPVPADGVGVYALSAKSFGDNADARWSIVSGSNITSTTPIPAAFLLLGSGLVGLFGVKRVRRGNAAA
ncbi:MAG: hypothetical protein Q7U56_09000 [Humidesulfovibrio sp.]|nr:hypothetical protein [Humidesulfovibrio sp.]